VTARPVYLDRRLALDLGPEAVMAAGAWWWRAMRGSFVGVVEAGGGEAGGGGEGGAVGATGF
jgi:hypothetical protein